jgi:hypothetical protein
MTAESAPSTISRSPATAISSAHMREYCVQAIGLDTTWPCESRASSFIFAANPSFPHGLPEAKSLPALQGEAI